MLYAGICLLCKLVKNPDQFDIMITPNLYGSIVSHIVAGISTGVGMTAGASIGKNYAMFSQGLNHSGMSLAGKNICNPMAIITSSIMMLRYLDLPYYADSIASSLDKVIEEGKFRTKDIGGNSLTSEVTEEIIKYI